MRSWFNLYKAEASSWLLTSMLILIRRAVSEGVCQENRLPISSVTIRCSLCQLVLCVCTDDWVKRLKDNKLKHWNESKAKMMKKFIKCGTWSRARQQKATECLIRSQVRQMKTMLDSKVGALMVILKPIVDIFFRSGFVCYRQGIVSFNPLPFQTIQLADEWWINSQVWGDCYSSAK